MKKVTEQFVIKKVNLLELAAATRVAACNISASEQPNHVIAAEEMKERDEIRANVIKTQQKLLESVPKSTLKMSANAPKTELKPPVRKINHSHSGVEKKPKSSAKWPKSDVKQQKKPINRPRKIAKSARAIKKIVMVKATELSANKSEVSSSS